MCRRKFSTFSNFSNLCFPLIVFSFPYFFFTLRTASYLTIYRLEDPACTFTLPLPPNRPYCVLLYCMFPYCTYSGHSGPYLLCTSKSLAPLAPLAPFPFPFHFHLLPVFSHLSCPPPFSHFSDTSPRRLPCSLLLLPPPPPSPPPKPPTNPQ